MDIRINTLRLHNFKGVRDAEYRFGGKNASIEGTNGSGKSTVFDAFTWLLFGKDHYEQTTDKFDIKPIDPETGEAIPRLDHWVEAELSVGQNVHTLRRCWVENWVKPTGEQEEVMKGHTSMFFVDGMDIGTKREYDATIRQWIDEGVFRMITNPLYFIDARFTDWKARRKALMSLVEGSGSRQRVREEFADLLSEIGNRPLENFRKMVADQRRDNKADLARCRERIAGMTEALPDEVDTAADQAAIDAIRAERNAKMKELEGEIATVDGAIADVNRANEEKKARIDAIYRRITEVQLKMGEVIAEAKKAAQNENLAARTAKEEKRRMMDSMAVGTNAMYQAQKRVEDSLADLAAERGALAAEMDHLRAEYAKQREAAFSFQPTTRCHACGQELPAGSIEEQVRAARDHYEADKKAEVDRIIGRANRIKERVRDMDQEITKVQERIDGYRAEIKEREDTYQQLKAEYEAIVIGPEPDLAEVEDRTRRTKAFLAMTEQELTLRGEASTISADMEGTNDLLLKKNRLEDDRRRIGDEYASAMQPFLSKQAVQQERRRQLDLIREKEAEAARIADELARLERLEFRIAEYVKADIDSVEGDINALFHVARWKMFDRTIDGGLVETCEVMSPEGVPYQSMNDAMKILCGMDTIRVFSGKYHSTAPIFVDNAEGIVCRSFDTPAQVIRLVVADKPLELKIEE